jgi:hypothetical protein
MIVAIIAILIGIFILYLLYDFLFANSGDVSAFSDKWLLKTMWLWLPIRAMRRLTHELFFKKKK